MLDAYILDLVEGNDLTHTKTGELSDRDLLVATAAVLYGVIPSDAQTQSPELMSFGDILRTHFNLATDEDVGYILELVVQLSKSQTALDSFYQLLVDKFTVEQRQFILAKTWKIIVADNHVDKTESEYSAVIRKKLGLSLEQAAHALSLVERGEA